MNDIPWLPYLAIDYLDHWLKPDMTAFEWGAGGSTGWLAQRVKSLVTIEHNPQWTIGLRDNIELQIIEPENGAIGDDPSNPHHYRARAIGDANFEKYAKVIDQYNEFDFILIDGRARASCLFHALYHIKVGGFIVIDNTERDYYLAQVGKLFENWNKITFFGNGPENEWKWETTFFQNE